MKPWYRAMKLFNDIAYSDENLIRYKLEEGDCAVFDNLRVLHGRREFHMVKGGYRRLRGSYIDWDEARSRIHVLENKRRPKE